MRTSVIYNDRNDDHKDKTRTIYSLLSSLKLYDEIWFIDWNSPKDRGPLLYNIINEIPHIGKIKHIVIDEKTALSLIQSVGVPYSKNVMIPDPIARNIGIRRATGDVIFNISGIDIFGPKLDDFLNMIKNIKPDTFYILSRRELNKEE